MSEEQEFQIKKSIDSYSEYKGEVQETLERFHKIFE